MHVGALLEFRKPADAPRDYLKQEYERIREEHRIPRPWNLKLIRPPGIGPRIPFMREDPDIDVHYHVRHSALPYPGGERELGVLVARLHSNPLDLHRPLWEMHLIEGLGEDGFAVYLKVHHSLIDGISAMRMMLRTLSTEPEESTPAFWSVGEGARSDHRREGDSGRGGLRGLAGAVRGGAETTIGLGEALLELGVSRVRDNHLAAPYSAPGSVLDERIEAPRRFTATEVELEHLKRLADASGGTLNDIVLYLSSSALRSYLREHASLPSRPLVAGIPVNLREADDESTGTAVGMIVTDLATNCADPLERLRAIQASMGEAKTHLRHLPQGAKTPYTLIMNGPLIAGQIAGLGGRVQVPYNIIVSNIPGPSEPLYFSGARLERISPLSLLLHGSALNITCISYCGRLNFGFTGARDTLPRLQSLAGYVDEALAEIDDGLLRADDQPGASPPPISSASA